MLVIHHTRYDWNPIDSEDEDYKLRGRKLNYKLLYELDRFRFNNHLKCVELLCDKCYSKIHPKDEEKKEQYFSNKS
jgi:hypothetical protein|tara:strand:+ start:180 stop:407 length:228 start_codon:yes stop_codon:yes gene_type:complete